MKVKVRAFGISRDILGGKEIIIDLDGTSVGDLRKSLSEKYPPLNKLNSLFIAVNQNYANDQYLLKEVDEVALIPPVSGG